MPVVIHKNASHLKKHISDFLDMIYVINRIINHVNLVHHVKISGIFTMTLRKDLLLERNN
jgi:hypothetical protein